MNLPRNIVEVPTRMHRSCVLVFRMNNRVFVEVSSCDETDTLKFMQDEMRQRTKGEMVLIDAIFIPQED